MKCTRSSRPTITRPTRRCRWPATSTPARPSLAERFFGDLAPGSVPDPIRRDARLDARRDLLLEDRVELPRLYLSWHSPAMFAPDDAELDVMADVVAHGKTSRLYRSLVFERRVATDVSAHQQSREIAGVFQVACTAAAGVALPELHTAVHDTIADIVRNGPTEIELERALIQSEANFIYRLQTIGGFGGKGDQLNAYNVYRGDPGYFEADRKRYRDVTAGGVAAAARRYLLEPPLVTLSVVPRGRRELGLAGAVEVSVS